MYTKILSVICLLILSILVRAQPKEAISITTSNGFYLITEQPLSVNEKDSASIMLQIRLFKTDQVIPVSRSYFLINGKKQMLESGMAGFRIAKGNYQFIAGDSGTALPCTISAFACKPGYLYRLFIYLIPFEKITLYGDAFYQQQLPTATTPTNYRQTHAPTIVIRQLANNRFSITGQLIHTGTDTLRIIRAEATLPGISSQIKIGSQWVDFEQNRGNGNIISYTEPVLPGRSVQFLFQSYHQEINHAKTGKLPYRLKYLHNGKIIYSNEILVQISPVMYKQLLAQTSLLNSGN
jgi:hypothetical protein